MSTRIVPPSPRLLRALAIMANKSDKAGRYVARPENGGYAIYRPESPGEMRIRENPLGASVDLFINDALAFSAPDYDDVAQYAQETYALSAFRLRDLHRDYVSNRNN